MDFSQWLQLIAVAMVVLGGVLTIKVDVAKLIVKIDNVDTRLDHHDTDIRSVRQQLTQRRWGDANH